MRCVSAYTLLLQRERKVPTRLVAGSEVGDSRLAVMVPFSWTPRRLTRRERPRAARNPTPGVSQGWRTVGWLPARARNPANSGQPRAGSRRRHQLRAPVPTRPPIRPQERRSGQGAGSGTPETSCAVLGPASGSWGSLSTRNYRGRNSPFSVTDPAAHRSKGPELAGNVSEALGDYPRLLEPRVLSSFPHDSRGLRGQGGPDRG